MCATRFINSILLVFVAWILALPCIAQESTADQQFASVAEIFQRKCIACHNDVDRQGDFSVQTSESFFEQAFVEAGSAAQSHLVAILSIEAGTSRMPKDAAPLSQEEMRSIRSWINAGAVWPDGITLHESRIQDFDWWSYQPIELPIVPAIEDAWIKTPIDAFVRAKQLENGLAPSPIADKRTLIRRLYFDLVGLPPTPEEVQNFEKDADENAYRNLADRLLESPAYGERWARHWLDVVKFADTCGYDKDKLRDNAWPYRDYVIRSLNQDKPYSRFVQEQIAGDVLFPDTPDGILGLGFIAAGPWDFIGHVEVPESKIDGQVARNLDRDDMVSNTINTFCSLTIQCARCHNHKFDPISQEDYYGLQSIFAAVDRAERVYDLDASVIATRESLKTQLAALEDELTELEATIAAEGGMELERMDLRLKELQPKLKVKKDVQFGYHSEIAKTADTEKWVQIEFSSPLKINRVVLRAAHDDFNGIGSGFCFPKRFRVELSNDGTTWASIANNTQSNFPNPGLSPVQIDVSAANEYRFLKVTATQLAERKNDFAFALAEIQVYEPDHSNPSDISNAKVSGKDSIEAPQRWSASNLVDGSYAQFVDPKAATEAKEIRAARSQLLAKLNTDERLRQRKTVEAKTAQLLSELKHLPIGKVVYAAATSFEAQGNFKPTNGEPRDVHVLHRGNVEQPLARAIPGFVPVSEKQNYKLPDSHSESERRAALAKWLTDPNNPFTWRSIVNRVWQYHFQTGLVGTPNDFGKMGDNPTHPKLLDWLAIRFRDGGQSLKDLHRLIVTSNVYQQSSGFDARYAAIDSSNQFLWRMPRRKLDAESIRDSMLSISGKLTPQMGGPGFYLFELEKTQHSPHYEYHKFDPNAPKSHRRSIYRFVVRSQPDPWMTTLDCADSSQSTPKRNETLTSLQALSLLNNRFTLAMANFLSERVQQEETELTRQVARAFELVTQRGPTATELAAMSDYARQHGLPNYCRFLFNLSEFVYVD